MTAGSTWPISYWQHREHRSAFGGPAEMKWTTRSAYSYARHPYIRGEDLTRVVKACVDCGLLTQPRLGPRVAAWSTSHAGAYRCRRGAGSAIRHGDDSWCPPPRGRVRGGMMISALGWHGDFRGMRRWLGSIGAGLAIVSVVASVLTGIVAPAHAEPASGQPAATPYPELRYFTEIDAAPYAVGDTPAADFPDQPGVWFVTAQGLSCGIWFRGSFGCTG